MTQHLITASMPKQGLYGWLLRCDKYLLHSVSERGYCGTQAREVRVLHVSGEARTALERFAQFFHRLGGSLFGRSTGESNE